MRNKIAVSPTNMESYSVYESLAKKKIKRLVTPCRLHVHSRRYRLADSDGISAKAAIDGIVHSGLLSDDRAQEVAEVSYSQEKIPKSQDEETIITIYTVLSLLIWFREEPRCRSASAMTVPANRKRRISFTVTMPVKGRENKSPDSDMISIFSQ